MCICEGDKSNLHTQCKCKSAGVFVCVFSPRPSPCLSTCLPAFLNDLVTIHKMVSASSILSGCLQSFLTHYQPTLFFLSDPFCIVFISRHFLLSLSLLSFNHFFFLFRVGEPSLLCRSCFFFCFLFHCFARVAFLPALFFIYVSSRFVSHSFSANLFPLPPSFSRLIFTHFRLQPFVSFSRLFFFYFFPLKQHSPPPPPFPKLTSLVFSFCSSVYFFAS